MMITDAVESAVHAVLELYTEHLADVEFPGVGKTALDEAHAKVKAHQLEVDRLQAELDSARELLAEARGELKKMSERAVAYARVYAEGEANEALSRRLAGIEQAGTKEAAPKRKRARKPKAQPTETAELPLADGETPETEAA